MRVLLTESEARLRSEILSRLEAESLQVTAAASARQALQIGADMSFDGAVIANDLPDMRGVDLIGQLRGAGTQVPVLLMTQRGQWRDKVDGLSTGASDYLIKPFDLGELVARVRLLLARNEPGSEPRLVVGAITLDMHEQSASIAGRPLELTAFEYLALEMLMINAGTPVSKQRLAERLYPQETERDSNVLEVIIGRLRRKLDPSRQRHPIETLRARGYRLSVERTALG
jgi:two-component system response regulator PhoP